MRRTGGRLGRVAGWVWLGTLCGLLLAHPACDSVPEGSDNGSAVRAVPIYTAPAITMDAARESAPIPTPILVRTLQEATGTPLAASPADLAGTPTVVATVARTESIGAIYTATPSLTSSPEPIQSDARHSFVRAANPSPANTPAAEAAGAVAATAVPTITPIETATPSATRAGAGTQSTASAPTQTQTATRTSTSVPLARVSATHTPTTTSTPALALTPTASNAATPIPVPTQSPPATAIPTSTHTPVPEDCRIKGNINMETGERVYHTPDSPWYGRTEIDTDAGERWFCSEREAMDAGWRAPKSAQVMSTAREAPQSAAGDCEAVVNINTAGAEELETLPGIGEVLAQRIVEHRRLNGPFSSVDELEEVERIGPVTVERIRDCISLE